MNVFPRARRVLFSLAFLGALACAASSQTVTIQSPASGATVASPVAVLASASGGSYPITALRLYVDNQAITTVSGSTMNTSASLSAGSHHVVVVGWNSSGASFSSGEYITVSGTSAGSPAASYGTTITNIDQMSGWQSCDACAGANGSGPTAGYSLWQYISSPSLDGQSAQFNLVPYVNYSNALWWKQVGAQPGASHFVYDLNFYLKDPNAAQALEFDVNQSVGGYKYIFGTECDIKGTHTWRVWDYNQHWVSTGIACNVPTAYTWHHLTWEFERVNGQTHFVAVTLDGVKSYVNQYHTPQPIGSVQELNTAFQMDAYAWQYSVWLDKVSLTYW